MAESLYACHFSNGFVKVGRNNAPATRIAQHAERVACFGIEIVAAHTVECIDGEEREQGLINRFQGLDFAEVCEWVTEAA